MKKKVDTPFEYKETLLDADGITVYYDATLSKLSYEDNKKEFQIQIVLLFIIMLQMVLQLLQEQ